VSPAARLILRLPEHHFDWAQLEGFRVRLLREEKVACVPGSAFGPSGEGFLRCCFATSLEQIQTACERMAGFLKRL
jgi:aminotransferase